MRLNRELQLEILNALAEVYPHRAKVLHAVKTASEDEVIANLIYLQEHGLLESGLIRGLNSWAYSDSKITAGGMDFIADDGGLSAILGVVTVRLHDDTIKQLIEANIMESDLTPDDKKKYLDQLKELPADATKHLVMKLVDLGVEKIPTAALGSIISSTLKAFGG